MRPPPPLPNPNLDVMFFSLQLHPRLFFSLLSLLLILPTLKCFYGGGSKQQQTNRMVFVVSGSGGRSGGVVFIQLPLEDEAPVCIPMRMMQASPGVRCCIPLHRGGRAGSFWNISPS